MKTKQDRLWRRLQLLYATQPGNPKIGDLENRLYNLNKSISHKRHTVSTFTDADGKWYACEISKITYSILFGLTAALAAVILYNIAT